MMMRLGVILGRIFFCVTLKNATLVSGENGVALWLFPCGSGGGLVEF